MLDEMFPVLARTKIVLGIPGPGAVRLGYGGRRILDAHASGAYVVYGKFPMD